MRIAITEAEEMLMKYTSGNTINAESQPKVRRIIKRIIR